MNTTRFALAGFIATGSAAWAASSQAAFVAVGTYDESTVSANQADGDVGTAYTRLDAQADLTALFAAGNAGVVTFDDDTLSGVSSFEVSFAGGSKTLTVLDDATGGDFSTAERAPGDSRTAISALADGDGPGDDRFGTLSANANLSSFSSSNDFYLEFGSIAGGDLDEAVLRAGLTVLGRDPTSGDRIYTATAFYSDGTSEALVGDTERTVAGNLAEGDLFYGFIAPDGESITRIEVTHEGNAFSSIDDLVFITGTPTVIPEPASLALLSLGGLCVMGRRRR